MPHYARPTELLVPEILTWLGKSQLQANSNESTLYVELQSENPSSIHWIIRATGNSSSWRMFVKHHSNDLLYHQERDALLQLLPYSGPNEPYGVPRLLASNDTLRCIALEWLEGRSIAQSIRATVRLLASPIVKSHGLALAERIGIWLRRLQERTAQPPVPLPRDELLGRLEELLGIVDYHRPGLIERRDQACLIGKFKQAISVFRSVPSCLNHNDFWFDHVWECQNRIAVLDFGRAKLGPAGRDQVQFLCRLEDLASLHPMVSKRNTNAMIHAFVRGCGKSGVDQQLWYIWRFMTRAEQLAGLTENHHMLSTSSLVDKLRERTLAKHLVALTDDNWLPKTQYNA